MDMVALLQIFLGSFNSAQADFDSLNNAFLQIAERLEGEAQVKQELAGWFRQQAAALQGAAASSRECRELAQQALMGLPPVMQGPGRAQ